MCVLAEARARDLHSRFRTRTRCLTRFRLGHRTSHARARVPRQQTRSHLTRLRCLTRLRLDLHLDLRRRRRCRNSEG